jgi:hypothetical protein
MPDSPQRSWMRRLLALLPALLFGLFALATQVGPDDATKNLGAWVNRFGLEWPQGLTITQAFTIFVVVVVGYYAFLFRRQLRVVPRRFAEAYRAFRALPPVSPEPTVQEVVAIEAVRAAFRNAGGPAADRILSLCRDVQNNEVKWVTFVWLLEREKDSLRDTKSRLDGALDRKDERLPSIRQALQGFLVAYGNVVRAVHDFETEGADLLGKLYADSYEDWERLHANWREQLNTIKEQSALASVRPAIEENLRTVPDLRYSTLYTRGRKLLEFASPDERAFLDLFCTDTTPNQGNPIEYSVYSAGLGLAHNKLLKLEGGENGASRFCLPKPVLRAWFISGRAPHLRRECVDVGPSAVSMGPIHPGGGVS